MNHREPIDERQVYREEDAAIRVARPTHERDEPAIGLALSGGGIRSATFNLGVLQALAELRLLKRFDYLSTVSGGGYIGSWLSALIHRQNASNEKTQKAHAEKLKAAEEKLAASIAGEVKEVRFLSQYSNYLTPKLGALSVDTWTAIAIYVRNLILNLTILFGIAVVAVLLLHGAYALAGSLREANAWNLAGIAGLLLVIVSITIGLNIDRQNTPENVRSRWWVLFGGIAPTFIAAWLTSIALQSYGEQNTSACIELKGAGGDACVATYGISTWVGVFAILNTLMWILCGAVRLIERADRHRKTQTTAAFFEALSRSRPTLNNLAAYLLATTAAGALAGCLLYLYADSFSRGALSDFLSDVRLHLWLSKDIEIATYTDILVRHVQGGFHLSVGMFIVVAIFSLSIALQIGIANRAMSESDREWLGRLGGVLYVYAIALTLLSLAVAVGPGLWVWWQASGIVSWLAGSAVAAWTVQTLIGIVLGKSAATGSATPKRPRLEKLLALTPYLFISGLLVAIAITTAKAVDAHYETPPRNALSRIELYCTPIKDAVPQTTTNALITTSSPCVGINRALTLPLVVMAYSWQKHLLVAIVILALVSLLAWRVDINLFSFQMFYRNRLTRCYLGASQSANRNDSTRRSNLFTSLSYADDLPLSSLRTGTGSDTSVQRPLHLLNVAINRSSGGELRMQERKAHNFTFSPMHTGYGEASIDGRSWYRRTRLFALYERLGFQQRRWWNRGASLGLAMATSGAAASPAMGYHSSPAMALLLTTFNVRLGAWLGNPRSKTKSWMFESPAFGLLHLLRELFGIIRSDSSFVYLSDGGHFENTAAYELIKRRLPLIVVSDCGADPNYEFADIAHLIRLVQIDLGHTIEIDLAPLKPDASGQSAAHFVIADIHYRDDPDHPNANVHRGKLIVMKPTLTDRSGIALKEFRQRTGSFPQQTTADQWFSETQFESYRELGYQSAHAAFGVYAQGRTVLARYL
jgi:hypothetical protein